MIEAYAPTDQPVETGSLKSRVTSAPEEVQVCSYDCFLAPASPCEIKMFHSQTRQCWHVDLESEVVEFSGCHYDGKLLLRGRFYYQPDMVVVDAFVPKRKEFLQWAEKLYRTAKTLLHKQPGVIYSYVGNEACRWRMSGGRFAHFRKANGEPMYDDNEILFRE
ncbi:MAG TPA: hypothetical protein VHZ52_07620 [Acidobacteriaceae bacterium]|nr:hypothetical protein [Acidobacteriaceae bacterium]